MEQKFREIFGFNVRIERQRRRMTQEHLAELADKSTKHLTKIENGGVTPSIYLVYKIAKAMNISIDKLCREEEL